MCSTGTKACAVHLPQHPCPNPRLHQVYSHATSPKITPHNRYENLWKRLASFKVSRKKCFTNGSQEIVTLSECNSFCHHGYYGCMIPQLLKYSFIFSYSVRDREEEKNRERYHSTVPLLIKILPWRWWGIQTSKLHAWQCALHWVSYLLSSQAYYFFNYEWSKFIHWEVLISSFNHLSVSLQTV